MASKPKHAAPVALPQPQPQRSLSRLLDAVVADAQLVSYILCAVGLLGLLALPLLERRISFDENALLAGSARPTIRTKSPHAHHTGKAFAASLQPSLFSPGFTAALQQQLQQQLGLDVYHHTFTVQRWDMYSSSSSGWNNSSSGRSRGRTCTNVHAVLASPRGDGKEALLLATPINHQEFATDFDQDASGALLALSLGAAVCHHLSTAAPWLAKEVVWLIPDASCGLVEAVQAWADAYQNPDLGHQSSGSLSHFERAGVLQQAVVLELPSGSFNTLQVSLEGYDGLLPKLDMYWLFRWYCYNYVRAPLELAHMGWTFNYNKALQLLPHSLSKHSMVQQALSAAQQHVLKATMALQFMWRQARSLPTGAHAPFKGLMVDAATLRVLRKDAEGYVTGPVGFTGATGNARRKSVDQAPGSSGLRNGQPQAPQVSGFDDAMMQLGDVVELILRSCSVLIERFHHSLFLYVLTDLDHYVSVERYIGPLMALICVLALQAAAVRRAQQDEHPLSIRQWAKDMVAQVVTWAWVQLQWLLPRRSASSTQRLSKLRLLVRYFKQQSQKILHKLTALLQRRRQTGGGGAAAAAAPTVLQRLVSKVQSHVTKLLRLLDEPAAHEQQEQWEVALELVGMLDLPKQQAEAAAGRAEWVAAIQLVAAVHTLTAAAGYAARCAPVLLPLLQQPDRIAAWVASVAAAPGEHVNSIGAVGGSLLALATAAACVTSLAASSCVGQIFDSTGQAGNHAGSSSSSSRYAAGLVRKVLAVELSAAAAACAAAACTNWALSYVGCLLLVPLAMSCTPALQYSKLELKSSTDSSNESSAAICKSRVSGRSLSVKVVLCCCSQLLLLLLLAAVSPVGIAAVLQAHWIASIVFGSSISVYMAFWAVYVPFWGFVLWSAV